MFEVNVKKKEEEKGRRLVKSVSVKVCKKCDIIGTSQFVVVNNYFIMY